MLGGPFYFRLALKAVALLLRSNRIAFLPTLCLGFVLLSTLGTADAASGGGGLLASVSSALFIKALAIASACDKPSHWGEVVVDQQKNRRARQNKTKRKRRYPPFNIVSLTTALLEANVFEPWIRQG